MRRFLMTASVMAALAACSHDSTTGPNTTHSSTNVQFVAGYDVTDTVLTKPLQSLVVEIHDNAGAILPGTVVRFQSAPVDTQPQLVSMLVASVSSVNFGTVSFDTTNSKGRASALVEMGFVAGVGKVIISVPDLGVQDTAYFTVTPGAAVKVQAFPKDTALYAGGTAQLHAAVIDNYGNPRNDPVSYAIAGGPATVSTTGAVTASATLGRASIVVKGDSTTDTAFVSVVPHGTIAAYQFLDSTGIVMVNLDGSGYKRLAPASASNYDVTMSWSPSGSDVVFATGPTTSFGTMFLEDVTTQGAVKQLIQSPTTGLYEATWPQYSRDGNYIYFSNHDNGASFALWRVDKTGANAVRVGPDLTSQGNLMWRSSPSQDGTREAFIQAGPTISVMTLSNQSIAAWGVVGQSPRWSPNAETIAFTSSGGGALKLMNSDGSNVRSITTSGRYYAETALDWSWDGRWLIARGSTELELIDTQTGLTLPLGFTAKLMNPAFKP